MSSMINEFRKQLAAEAERERKMPSSLFSWGIFIIFLAEIKPQRKTFNPASFSRDFVASIKYLWEDFASFELASWLFSVQDFPDERRAFDRKHPSGQHINIPNLSFPYEDVSPFLLVVLITSIKSALWKPISHVKPKFEHSRCDIKVSHQHHVAARARPGWREIRDFMSPIW